MVGCEDKDVEQQGEVVYSHKEVQYINDTRRVIEVSITEYKDNKDKQIVTLDYVEK